MPSVWFPAKDRNPRAPRHLTLPAELAGHSQRSVTHQGSTPLNWEDIRTHRTWGIQIQTLHFGPETNFLAFLLKHETWNFRDRIQMYAQNLGFLVTYTQRTSRFKVFMGFSFCWEYAAGTTQPWNVTALCLNTLPISPLIVPHGLEIYQISHLLFKTYATSPIQPKLLI